MCLGWWVAWASASGEMRPGAGHLRNCGSPTVAQEPSLPVFITERPPFVDLCHTRRIRWDKWSFLGVSGGGGQGLAGFGAVGVNP